MASSRLAESIITPALELRPQENDLNVAATRDYDEAGMRRRVPAPSSLSAPGVSEFKKTSADCSTVLLLGRENAALRNPVLAGKFQFPVVIVLGVDQRRQPFLLPLVREL